jgi:hypothetical protein
MTKNLASSVNQRLMNRAKAEQRPFNELAALFCTGTIPVSVRHTTVCQALCLERCAEV